MPEVAGIPDVAVVHVAADVAYLPAACYRDLLLLPTSCGCRPFYTCILVVAGFPVIAAFLLLPASLLLLASLSLPAILKLLNAGALSVAYACRFSAVCKNVVYAETFKK